MIIVQSLCLRLGLSERYNSWYGHFLSKAEHILYLSLVNAGQPAPEFRDTPYSFTVTLHNTRVRKAIPAWESNMNERQLRAVAYVQENGRITNREYRSVCPDVSTETLRLDLVDLVERGLLLKIGAKKGTYYILKKSPPQG